nr:protein FAR1-related sequence 5-like [Tanacetum cinerariifolium]
MNKSFNTFVVQSEGYEDLPFTEKDYRNYIDKVKRLKFGEGYAEAIQGYCMKVVVNHHGQTMKKRSKKEKERNKNDFFLPIDINHSYANFPLHYDRFIPSNAFQQVSPVLQNIAVQMQQSSHLNSIDGV